MKTAALVAFLVGIVGVATAADKDAAGTWKIKQKFGEKEIERTLKLEVDGGKVTGTISGGFGGKGGKGGNETKIEEGTIKDGVIKFQTTRVGGKDKDQKTVTQYEAKVEGDTIKGTTTTKFGEKENKSDFEGKREKKKD